MLVTAAMIGGSVALFQSNTVSLKTTERQTLRQELVLAREIARTGYNRVRSEARRKEREAEANGQEFTSVKALVEAVNGGPENVLVGTFEGGTYEARLEIASPGSYVPTAEGRFGKAVHRIGQGRVFLGMLQVPRDAEYRLEAAFIESQAGYCSAIYLQRILADLEDDEQPEPELIFASGKNRDDVDTTYEQTLAAGTQMNFLLAVDKNCDLWGQEVPITHSNYDYTHPALEVEAGSLDDMEEGKYAMLEKHPTRKGVWRVAFEDLRRFSDKQHADVKKNSYGPTPHRKNSSRWQEQGGVWTYGGSGWSERDGLGYYKLYDHSNLPDFSDQVFEIELVKVDPSLGASNGDDD